MKGIFETHLHVADLERSMRFYEDILKLEVGATDEKRRSRLYWVSGRGNCMFGIWEKKGEIIPPNIWLFGFRPKICCPIFIICGNGTLRCLIF